LGDFAQKLNDFTQAVMTGLRDADKPADGARFTYVRIGRTRVRLMEALRVLEP
jgi:hypothetical protein